MSAAVAAAFRESGIVVRENFGAIEAFEKTPSGVRMVFSKDGARDNAEAAVAVDGGRLGGRHRRAEPGDGPASRPTRGVTCASTPICGPPHHTSSPRATSPAA